MVIPALCPTPTPGLLQALALVILLAAFAALAGGFAAWSVWGAVSGMVLALRGTDDA